MLDLANLGLNPSQVSAGGIPVYDSKPWFGGYFSGGKDFVTPMAVNGYSVLSIPPYWRAMNFLSTNLASFPRSVHKDGAKPEDGAPRHPLERLLRRRPNACQNSTVFWRTLFFHAADNGNGFAEIVRGSQARAAALLNLLPHDVCPFRYDHNDGDGAQQYYFVRSTQRILRGADIIHLQALGYDGMSGSDPTQLHSETFQRASVLNRYQTKYLQKGTVIRGAVEIPQGVTEDQVEQIVDRIKEFRGLDAERDVLVLSDGAKLENKTINPKDSEIVAQGGMIVKDIAQLTGVPPQFLYEFGESKYNNSIEQMGQDVVRYTFRPWIEQTEDELTTKLLSESDQDEGYAVRLNPGALLRGSTKEQEDGVAASVNAGIRTKNEGRKLLDLPPVADPDADKLKTLGDSSPTGETGPAPSTPTSEGETATTSGDAGTETPPAGDAATTPQGEAEAGVVTDQTLNGAQITAALEVITKLAEGEIGATAATELLVAVGIQRAAAEEMVKETADAPPKPKPAPSPTPPEDDDAAETSTRKKDDDAEKHARLNGYHVTAALDVLKQLRAGEITRKQAIELLVGVGVTRANANSMVDELKQSASSPAQADAYSALTPVLEAACERVDRKTTKAFDNASGKAGNERTIWGNVFAEQQATYVRESLGPIDASLAQFMDRRLNITLISERYAVGIRRSIATGEAAPKLLDVIASAE
jgi:HK97 family phage portal protein